MNMRPLSDYIIDARAITLIKDSSVIRTPLVAEAVKNFEKESLGDIEKEKDENNSYWKGWNDGIRQCLAIHDKHFGDLE